ncbi:Nn.00g092350.m01.CDS01 [Neocucurbitaria sp. VM-36]
MNTSVSAYTNLESLLLFQCLHAYGLAPSVFARISDLLKKNPDITGHKFFQAGRLSPDALRNFYLERLKKESEHEQAADDQAHTGDVANPRKRKLPTSSLPTVQESLQHQHLIPKLVTKLYASYRNEITEHIRAEEERYERLQRDITSIQRGEWDDQLRERASRTTPASRSPTASKKSPHLAQKPLQPNVSPQLTQNGAQGGPVIAPARDLSQQPSLEAPRPPPSQNRQSSPSQRKKQASADLRRTPSTPQPLAAPTLPQNNETQPLASAPRFKQSSSSNHNAAPFPSLTPYPPGQHPQTPHNVQPQPSPHQSHARPSHPQSPAVGSPGAQFQPPAIQPYSGSGVPQYGPSPAPPHYSPTPQRFPQQPPGPQSPGVQAPYQQQRAQYPQPGQPAYPPVQAEVGQPPPQAGFMLPPFQVSPQDPSRVHHQASVPLQHPQVSTPTSNRQHARPNVQTPGTGMPGVPPVHPLVVQARQSFSTPMSTRSPLSTAGTPASAKSFWKRQSFGGTPGSPASPRPIIEPIDDFQPLVQPPQSPPKAKAQRRTRAKGKGKEKELAKDAEPEPAPDSDAVQDAKLLDAPEEDTHEVETRSGRSRRKTTTKRTRPGSIASSRAGGSGRDRSRSQSILSHTETIAADNESQAGHRIKSERGVSVDAIEEETVSTPSQVSTRRRGAAVHAPPSTRRKRNAREASLEEAEDHFTTSGLPRTIIAQRHFSKMCAPIMNDISSHKHASTFTTAVRAKDAEGYYDIIKRPTDLKSISKAIATGAKQVAAAASDTPVGSPGGGGGVVELPATMDNMPPKAIVNAAQLEKELMRMFVNAVMFNPGEDGVVEDAREMFETVQQSVSNWRNVERSSGRTEVEDTPTAEEEEVVQVSKRRKV